MSGLSKTCALPRRYVAPPSLHLALPRPTYMTSSGAIVTARRGLGDRWRILSFSLLVDPHVDCQDAFSSRHVRDGCRVPCVLSRVAASAVNPPRGFRQRGSLFSLSSLRSPPSGFRSRSPGRGRGTQRAIDHATRTT